MARACQAGQKRGEPWQPTTRPARAGSRRATQNPAGRCRRTGPTPSTWGIGPAGPPRRRRGRIAAAAGAALAIAAASRAPSTLSSESAALVEQLGSAGTIRGTFAEQRSPFFESMAMTEDVAGQHVPISMILTKSEMYLKLGAMPGMPGAAAGKWIKIPLTGLGGGSPIASMLQNLTGQNPMSEVRMLGAGGHLRRVGTQPVGGVATTRRFVLPRRRDEVPVRE